MMVSTSSGCMCIRPVETMFEQPTRLLGTGPARPVAASSASEDVGLWFSVGELERTVGAQPEAGAGAERPTKEKTGDDVDADIAWSDDDLRLPAAGGCCTTLVCDVTATGRAIREAP